MLLVLVPLYRDWQFSVWSRFWCLNTNRFAVRVNSGTTVPTKGARHFGYNERLFWPSGCVVAIILLQIQRTECERSRKPIFKASHCHAKQLYLVIVYSRTSNICDWVNFPTYWESNHTQICATWFLINASRLLRTETVCYRIESIKPFITVPKQPGCRLLIKHVCTVHWKQKQNLAFICGPKKGRWVWIL
jgi:hypothetical protein